MVNNAGIFMGLSTIVDEPTENFDKTMVREKKKNCVFQLS